MLYYFVLNILVIKYFFPHSYIYIHKSNTLSHKTRTRPLISTLKVRLIALKLIFFKEVIVIFFIKIEGQSVILTYYLLIKM